MQVAVVDLFQSCGILLFGRCKEIRGRKPAVRTFFRPVGDHITAFGTFDERHLFIASGYPTTF